MAVSTFTGAAGAAGGNDSGGTVIASASNADAASAFTLAGDFAAGEHVIQIQGEANATVTILLLDSGINTLQSKAVTTDAGGAAAVTFQFPVGVAKLGVSGLSGYITVLKFEAVKTNATVGPLGFEHFSGGQSDPLQFTKLGLNSGIPKGNLYIKENAHSWFIPNAGQGVARYWIISKKTGQASFPTLVRESTGYQYVMTGSHLGFAVTDDYIMLGGNELQSVQNMDIRDVVKFVYNEATDQYVCDMDDAAQHIKLALPTNHTSTQNIQSFEYAPNIGANGTIFTKTYGQTFIHYSQDHGATWSTMGGSVSSNGANLRYYRDDVNGNDHLLYNGFPYTADLWYCNNFSDLANATWNSWNWPSTSYDYASIDYNKQGQFWTTVFETDKNSAFVATSLGGAWASRTFTSLHGNPSGPLSVNGTTVIFSRSCTSNTTNTLIAWSTDGTTWNTINTAGAPSSAFYNGVAFTNNVNPILYASGTKIRGIGDYGGFQFDTATNTAMEPFSPLWYHYSTQTATDPTGQYAVATVNDSIAASADYGNSWTYFSGANVRFVHYWNNKFWLGEYNNSNDNVVSYNPATQSWTRTFQNIVGTYPQGMTAMSDSVAFTFDYTTTGTTWYTNDGGATWNGGQDCLMPVSSRDNKVAYGIYSSNVAAFTSTATLDSYVVDVNGTTVNRGGGSNGDFYIQGIPYKDGAVLVGVDTGNQQLVNFIYIVDGVAQHGISGGWKQVNISSLLPYNITSFDIDTKPQLWSFAGTLFCEVTKYGYLTGLTSVTLKSLDDGATWSLESAKTNFRNGDAITYQSTVSASNGDWHNFMGNADYNVYDRGYFMATTHAGDSGQQITSENNISVVKILGGVEEA